MVNFHQVGDTIFVGLVCIHNYMLFPHLPVHWHNYYSFFISQNPYIPSYIYLHQVDQVLRSLRNDSVEWAGAIKCQWITYTLDYRGKLTNTFISFGGVNSEFEV